MKLLKRCFYALFFLSFSISAQSNYKQGYIVTKSNHKIKGELNLRKDVKLSESCSFKLNDKKLVYLPFDIKSFGFKDGRLFESKKIDDNIYFLEVLVKGELNVYYLATSKGNKRQYYVGKGNELKELVLKEVILNKNEKQYINTTIDHQILLKQLTFDAPTLEAKIDLLKKIDRKKIIDIAKEYHDLTCKTGEECKIYKGRANRTKFSGEVLMGMKSFKSDRMYNNEFNSKNNIITRFLLNMSIPQLGEEYHLVLGLDVANIDLYDLNYNSYPYTKGNKTTSKFLYGILAKFQYLKSNKRLKPKLSLGLSIMDNFSLTAGVGLNYTISKKIAFSTNYDIQTDSSQLLLGGLLYNF